MACDHPVGLSFGERGDDHFDYRRERGTALSHRCCRIGAEKLAFRQDYFERPIGPVVAAILRVNDEIECHPGRCDPTPLAAGVEWSLELTRDARIVDNDPISPDFDGDRALNAVALSTPSSSRKASAS